MKLKEVKVRLDLTKKPAIEGLEIHSPFDVQLPVYNEILNRMDEKQLLILNLNQRSKPINYTIMNYSDAFSDKAISKIFRNAVLANANSMMIMQHIDSLNLDESDEIDQIMVRNLVSTASVMNVRVLDFIKSGENVFYSLAQNHSDIFNEKADLRVLKALGFSEPENGYDKEDMQNNRSM